MDHLFKFGQIVIADGEMGNPMFVTAVEYRHDYVSFECTYWMNGEQRNVWLPQWRLKAREDDNATT